MSFAQEAFEQRTPHDVVVEAIEEFVEAVTRLSVFDTVEVLFEGKDKLERVTGAIFARSRLVLAEWPVGKEW